MLGAKVVEEQFSGFPMRILGGGNYNSTNFLLSVTKRIELRNHEEM